MPATTCLLCHGPIHLTQEELKLHQVPTVGQDCRSWLAKGMGIDTLHGLAFSMEQFIMISCLEAAVEAGHVGQEARDEADRMIAVMLQDLCTRYGSKRATLPTTAPTTALPAVPELPT